MNRWTTTLRIITARITVSRAIAAAVGLLLTAFLLIVYIRVERSSSGVQPAPSRPSTAPAAQQLKPELPAEEHFRPAAETELLRLWVDEETAHFKVESKQSGQIWHSYPDPAHWPEETVQGTWQYNLLSPVMVEYVDARNFKSQSKIISWLEDGGQLEDFSLTEAGFRTTFVFGATGFRIPVEVRLQEDWVETRIYDEGIAEEELSLLSLKLYPLFGARPSDGEEGYLLVPDGSGALIRFKANRTEERAVYLESVYGPDGAFFNENTGRSKVGLPVFGLKAGDSGFVGVMTAGEEYASLFAAPSGAYGSYNWIAPEWQYRRKFFQNTSRNGADGFYTYNKEPLIAPERVTRYFLLEGAESSYAGMASRYRSYLTEEQGLKPLAPASGNIPLFVDLIGADTRRGVLWDQYLPATTTAEATEIIARLHKAGIANMTVQYAGWQQDGYSTYGGLLPVDSRLGGNEGMRRFIQSAHSLQASVYLSVNYSWNNTGLDGFKPRYQGVRNLAGAIQRHLPPGGLGPDEITLVSPRYAAGLVERDLPRYRELGADGLYFQGGIGSVLNSDYNTRHEASRREAMELQQDMLNAAGTELGGVSVENASLYAVAAANHIHHLTGDYSYDLFIDEAVPFVQMALHGLITYSWPWANLRDDGRRDFLRSIEYGAYPSYVFAAADSDRLKGAYSAWYFSLNYRDWLEQAAAEYRQYNEALGDVQDKAIIGHRTLAPDVKETVYEGGKTIIVNYGAESYSDGRITVSAGDFAVLGGTGQ